MLLKREADSWTLSRRLAHAATLVGHWHGRDHQGATAIQVEERNQVIGNRLAAGHLGKE